MYYPVGCDVLAGRLSSEMICVGLAYQYQDAGLAWTNDLSKIPDVFSRLVHSVLLFQNHSLFY